MAPTGAGDNRQMGVVRKACPLLLRPSDFRSQKATHVADALGQLHPMSRIRQRLVINITCSPPQQSGACTMASLPQTWLASRSALGASSREAMECESRLRWRRSSVQLGPPPFRALETATSDKGAPLCKLDSQQPT